MLNEYTKGNIPSVYEMGSNVYLIIARKKDQKREAWR